jgi:hypothetical protein
VERVLDETLVGDDRAQRVELVGENLLLAAIIRHDHGALFEAVEFLLEVGGPCLHIVMVDVGETRLEGVGRKQRGGGNNHGEKFERDSDTSPTYL